MFFAQPESEIFHGVLYLVSDCSGVEDQLLSCNDQSLSVCSDVWVIDMCGKCLQILTHFYVGAIKKLLIPDCSYIWIFFKQP